MTLIGNSGFEYIVGQKGQDKNDYRGVSRYGTRYDIRNIKTKEIIFSLWYGKFKNFKRDKVNYRKDNRKFLGLDNKYYYLTAINYSTIDWGQIQSDGAVLRPDRSILTILAFFPNYKEPEIKVPVNKPVIVTELPYVPTVITIPKTISPIKTAIPVIPTIPDTPPVKDEISWIQKIIKKIIDWMKKILNR